jgi:hypothetical protein
MYVILGAYTCKFSNGGVLYLFIVEEKIHSHTYKNIFNKTFILFFLPLRKTTRNDDLPVLLRKSANGGKKPVFAPAWENAPITGPSVSVRIFL